MFLMNKNLCIVMVVKFLIRNWISIVGCDYPHFNKDLLSMSAFAYPLSRAFYFVSLRFIYLLWGTLFRIIFTNNFIFFLLLYFFFPGGNILSTTIHVSCIALSWCNH